MAKIVHEWETKDVPGCGWSYELLLDCPNCERPFLKDLRDSQQTFGVLLLAHYKNNQKISLLQDRVTHLETELAALTLRVMSCKNYKDKDEE